MDRDVSNRSTQAHQGQLRNGNPPGDPAKAHFSFNDSTTLALWELLVDRYDVTVDIEFQLCNRDGVQLPNRLRRLHRPSPDKLFRS